MKSLVYREKFKSAETRDNNKVEGESSVQPEENLTVP